MADAISKVHVEYNRQKLIKNFIYISNASSPEIMMRDVFNDIDDERYMQILNVYLNRYQRIYIRVKNIVDSNNSDRFSWYEKAIPTRKYITSHVNEDFKAPSESSKRMTGNYELYCMLKDESKSYFFNKTNEEFMPEKEALQFIALILSDCFGGKITEMNGKGIGVKVN